ncbi:MAG: endonuclease/exonuclease/phosphatase family metal-dependent hydrolase [Rhodothermales bacterium]|jgi:endonuclease/exonuclease/phosphatase family metal-dependent hydrolase
MASSWLPISIPRSGQTTHPAKPPTDEVRIVAYNIAKCFVQRGGFRFRSQDGVNARLDRLAAVINAEDPHLVFLSEAMFECGPCPVNQVTELAERCNMHAWSFGENYNIGFPLFRIAGGNAILATIPLEPVKNIDLPGRRPFWVTRNNRRSLWMEATIRGETLQLAAMHNDSFEPANNMRQTQTLLDFLDNKPGILAGDFNAEPDWESMQALQTHGFSGEFDSPPTFPSEGPERPIDFILAPPTWTLVEHRVIQNDASDHCAVFARFQP